MGDVYDKSQELNGSSFQRSLSLPPAQRKQRVTNFPFIEQNEQTVALSEKRETGSLFKSRFGNKSLNMFRISKKSDIRVSKFDPIGIHLPDHVVSTIRNVEEKSLMDAVRTTSMCNGKAPCPDQNHHYNNNSNVEAQQSKPPSNATGIVKFIQGSMRRISNANMKAGSSCTIKTIEIVRNTDDVLGIFIKKKKVSSEIEAAMQSRNQRNVDSSREGIFVSRLASHCTAAKQGLLQVGDEILAVNTISVSSFDVKVVATMMCMLKRLILTVRTTKSVNSPSQSNSDDKVFPFSNIGSKKESDITENKFSQRLPSLPSLPEKDMLKTSENDASGSKVTTYPAFTLSGGVDVKNSIYDNNLHIETGSEGDLQNTSVDNIIQLRFDESYQILLDAIACCDKSTNLKVPKFKVVEGFPSDDIPDATKDLVSDANHFSGEGNLLTEILQSMKHDKPWKPYLTSRYQSSPDLIPLNQQSDDCHTSFNYQQIPLSKASSTQEVNLDEVDVSGFDSRKHRKLQHSQSLNPQITPTYIHSLRKADHVKFSSANSKEGDYANLNHDDLGNGDSVAISETLQNTSPSTHEAEAFERAFSNRVPKFPITLSDDLETTDMLVKPLIDKLDNNSSITVDKKREWLSTGYNVPQELEKRINGDGMEKNSACSAFKKCTNCHLMVPTADRNLSHTNNNDIVQTAASANVFPGIHTTISESALRRKTSLRSPVEKCPKSLFSVTGTPAFTAQATASEHAASGGCEHKATLSNNVDSYDNCQSTTLENTNLKTPSPSRPRKKNWSRMLSKKFRIAGNSDVGMSEYACWATDDLPNSSKETAEEVASEVIMRRDPSLMNQYHIDPSVAQQRRLSRQLCLDSKSRELQQKSLSITQFEKYKQLPLVGNGNSVGVDGCLVITLYGVKELKKGLCEAYCIAQVDDVSTRRIGTTMQTCKGATTWNQCFEMSVQQAKNLHFTVYTWDTRGGKHKATSRAVINLPLLMQGAKSAFRYSNRLAVSLQPRGTLYVRLALESSPFPVGPLLFGADLQSICDREDGRDSVPKLVRSCISEVEKRGMHVVGIYRLCGSAIVKKDLRRKLEGCGGDLDLNASEYPDINVITGILKDFLRELPQPLFPPELLEAVTSAMEENPGPTPNTVIKEPFAPSQSFLTSRSNDNSEGQDQKSRSDALLQRINNLTATPAERSTLYLLMNHLKEISLHSDKNKMSSQNLAVCFGPVLLGPANPSPASRMNLDAAIGFKRHIQVLNYMMSNWPAYCPMPVVTRRTLKHDENRVSLTRRLSRVCSEELEDDAKESDEMMDRSMQSDHRASLASIPEDSPSFCDPDVEMYDVTTTTV